MRYLDEGEFHPDAFASEDGWAEDLDAADLTDALRSSLSEEYADASDEEIDDALANVLDSMSAAEAFNFTSALNRIGKSASQLASDPTFAAVAQTALPILGSAAGTMIAGQAGTGLGAKFGSLAASALPTRPAAAPAPPRPVPPPRHPLPRYLLPRLPLRLLRPPRPGYSRARQASLRPGLRQRPRSDLAGRRRLYRRGPRPGAHPATRRAAEPAGDRAGAAPGRPSAVFPSAGLRDAEPGVRRGGRRCR